MARVVIAEDEGILRMSFSMILRGLDQEVVSEASCGAEAVIAADEQHPELIFMDISMNGKEDGINACRLIKQQHPEVKIVFVSAHPESIYADILAEIPYDGFMEKPVNEGQFESCLSRLQVIS